MDGIEATKKITAEGGGLSEGDDPTALKPRVLMLTTFEQDEYGARGADSDEARTPGSRAGGSAGVRGGVVQPGAGRTGS